MTLRTFWAILIKILGVYIILESLISIPQVLAFAISVVSQQGQSGASNMFFIEISYFILLISVFAAILYYCLFRTDWIIDKLKLDKGFEQEYLAFNIHRSSILKITIMLIGGVMLIDSFPLLCKSLLECFQMTGAYGGFAKNPNLFYVVLYLVKTFIGYFLITCSRMVVNYIELKRKKPSSDIIAED